MAKQVTPFIVVQVC